MGNREYGIDFIYQTLGKITGENAVLKMELAYADTALKELEKDMAAKEKAAQDKETEWAGIVWDRDAEIRRLKETIESLEEQLAEKDQMLAGFNHEHRRAQAEAAKEADW